MKILIVEDEAKTGDYLRQGLSEAGFVVDLARDGLDGLHLALEGGHDLLVLDVMLPSLDGWGILQTLRRSGRTMPVLFLTARDQVEDRVRWQEKRSVRKKSAARATAPRAGRACADKKTTWGRSTLGSCSGKAYSIINRSTETRFSWALFLPST